MRRRPTLGLLLTAMLIFPTAGGLLNPHDPWERTATIQDPNSEPEDGFGATVAVDGDTMVVGHPLEDHKGDLPSGKDVGAVTVYERIDREWVAQETFYGSAPLGQFGSAIAVDGDTFVTNAPGRSASNLTASWCPHSTAELYVYERIDGRWQPTETLQPPGVDSHSTCLGAMNTATHGLALDGDILVAATLVIDEEVFVWRRSVDGWTLEETLQPRGGYGGVDVSEDAGRLVIGSKQEEVPHKAWRAVEVYERTNEGWEHDNTLISGDRLAGYRVELSEDGSTIAATGHSWSRSPEYVPVNVWSKAGQGWSEVTKLWPWDANDFDPWISDIDVSAHGTTLAVGTWLDDVSPSLAPGIRSQIPVGVATIRTGSTPEQIASPFGNGAAYVFRQTPEGDWDQAAKIMPRDEAGTNLFGWAVSLGGDRLAVGAPMDRGALTQPNSYDTEAPGAVYLFEDSGGWECSVQLAGDDTRSTGAHTHGDDFFGMSVAITGSSAWVGAPNNGDDNEGTVYAFEPGETAPRLPALNSQARCGPR